MKYNKLSLVSVGFIGIDIILYIILLGLDSKNIHLGNFDGFVTIIYTLPFLAFVTGIAALFKIKKTNEKGTLIAQLALFPFVIIIFFTYVNLTGNRGSKHPTSSNILH